MPCDGEAGTGKVGEWERTELDGFPFALGKELKGRSKVEKYKPSTCFERCHVNGPLFRSRKPPPVLALLCL